LADAEKSDPHAVRFRAFVSYSHADAAIAQRLHRKIETYQLPRRLQSDSKTSKNNGRLGRIFRDREDLPAAEDLSESVKRALAGSRVLVVVCSPDARESIWVAREIELFRALHPDRPILAALVRGEPEEAFPPALLDGAEPLAADLRKQGDGWRLGFLKIVAGIAGVPLDALVQRDAARRIRRVMVVTGGTLVALLVMIGMTIFAIQSRNEAQHQQAEAEGLVEYMLTDLRTELKGVGRLDVMTKVNERAMDYYDDQDDLSNMPAESLERRARILHAMGEDDEKRGDLAKALAKFTEAHRVTEASLARDPDNPDRIYGHAQSEYWVGYIAYLKKDWAKAERYWQEYKKYADQLVTMDGRNPEWLRESGYADGNLCTLSIHRTDSSKFHDTSCHSALKRMERILEENPNDHKNIEAVANRNAWMADFYLNSKQINLEKKHRIKAIILTNQLIQKDPKNKDYKEIWLSSQLALARTELRIGERKIATDRARSIKRQLMLLAKSDPENVRWNSKYLKSVDSIINKGVRDVQAR
jgi:tetratricopeptide (TPR) repeat protein